ncbi:hypothetical protein A4X09_0g5868 [Tilletia walkeri]|uniref:J domain-containing protein n=1 Tax=Tilletia walkeri TaxID=117179 RepID=A0A8X7N4P2_9BASI|nr:hypothetical protein A4X09_0g5868 [Tilletia walkeri]
MSSAQPEPLSAFLRRTRSAALEFLRNLNSDSPPKDVKCDHLTLIMGNEAGDLDSLASSIAIAYLLTHLPHPPLTNTSASNNASSAHTLYAPLIQTAAADLYLRPENEAICRFADIDSSAQTDALLTIDALERGVDGAAVVSDSLGMDLGSDPRLGKETSGGKVSFGIVDHPSLIPRWGSHQDRDVQYIVDHHKDEGAHPDAKVRFMLGPGSVPAGEAPIGSASSMVVELFQDELLKAAKAGPAGSQIPKAVADLLISAIVIDTDNLRAVPRGRATPRDVLSHAILLPLSSFAPGSGGNDASLPLNMQNGGGEGGPSAPSTGGSRNAGGANFGGDLNPPSAQGGPSSTSASEGSKPSSSGPTDSLSPDQDAMSEVDDAPHCDVDEPAMFAMCEDVEMETDDVPSTPLRSDFSKARCFSESTARGCSGGCGNEPIRPSVCVDEPPPMCGGGRAPGESAAGDEDEDDAEAKLMEEMSGRDLYRILGLKRGVEQSAIRTAYRREALKCHPDRARSLRDAERRTCRFKLLVNAYEILSDPVKRRQYDLFHDPLTSGLQSETSTPGASYTSSSFSYSYSSSYNSSSFFDQHGSSFSSSSYFSTSPPPSYKQGGGGFAGGGGGFRAAGGGKWKFETYEELRAEELARTETRTVAESLFGKQPTTKAVPTQSQQPQHFSMHHQKIAPTPLAAVNVPPVAVIEMTPAVEKLPPSVMTAPAPTTTTTKPKTFTFVWESPAESLRRARARPGAMGTGTGTAAASNGIGARLANGGATMSTTTPATLLR